jgi:hypothetical protein
MAAVRKLRDLSEREAQRHLDKYVRDMPLRLRALQERACAECPRIRAEQLDRTAESLVPTWEFLVQHVERKLPSEFPPPDPWWLPEEPGEGVDPDLAEWADRIGLYVAACFKASFPDRGIRWKAAARDAADPRLANQPVLSGFARDFCPRLLVFELALRVPQGIHAGRTLCDAYDMWSDDVLPPRTSASQQPA